MINQEDQKRLDQIVQKDTSYVSDLFSIWSGVEEQDEILRHALSDVSSRAAALRLLLHLADETKKAVFADLIDLASVGHSDIVLCRLVIKSLPREWVLVNIESAVHTVLDGSDDYEAYRRLAELIRELDPQLLSSLVERAAASNDSDIREVAQDFEKEVE